MSKKENQACTRTTVHCLHGHPF